MLLSLSLPSPNPNLKLPKFPNPHYHIKFRTTYHQNLRYLKTLGIINPQTSPKNLPLPSTVDHIILTVDFLKSNGFTDADFPTLFLLSPQLFSDSLHFSEISPILDFLRLEIPSSIEESRNLVLKNPNLLLSDVELCLRPTLNFLRRIGIEKEKLNGHLLGVRVEKLRRKVRFLEGLGFEDGEVRNMCVRCPAILGYAIENNLRPKVEYLVEGMERSVDELKTFPQYFGFSLDKRIIPRHLHLKERNADKIIPLNRMLMWSDEKFYAKWK